MLTKRRANNPIPSMPSSPNISFVPHDVARLLRKRFEQRSRTSGLTRAQWLLDDLLLQTLSLIKSNLLEACAQPAVDREKIHG